MNSHLCLSIVKGSKLEGEKIPHASPQCWIMAVVLSPLLKCQPLSSSDLCKCIHCQEPVLLSFFKDQ